MTKITVWEKRLIKLNPIEVDASKRGPIDHAKEAANVCQFLVGHIPGDVLDYISREIAAKCLPYDKINDESVKDFQARVSGALNTLADNL